MHSCFDLASLTKACWAAWQLAHHPHHPRSAAYKILTQVRRFCALCLSRLPTLHVRWISSEVNYSVESSRIEDGSKSKSPFHLLPVHGDEPPRSPKSSSSARNQGARDLYAGPVTAWPRKTAVQLLQCRTGPSLPRQLSASQRLALDRNRKRPRAGVETVEACGNATRARESSSTSSELEYVKTTQLGKGSPTVNGGRALHRVRKYIKFLLDGESAQQHCGHGCVKSTVSKSRRRVALVLRQISLGINDGVTKRLGCVHLDAPSPSRISLLGKKLLAGLTHLVPEFGRRGSRFTPRARWALKRWRRQTPGHSRRAHPEQTQKAVAKTLATQGDPFMALFVLISPSANLRPSEDAASGKHLKVLRVQREGWQGPEWERKTILCSWTLLSFSLGQVFG